MVQAFVDKVLAVDIVQKLSGVLLGTVQPFSVLGTDLSHALLRVNSFQRSSPLLFEPVRDLLDIVFGFTNQFFLLLQDLFLGNLFLVVTLVRVEEEASE